MSEQVAHNWQPSKRMITLINRRREVVTSPISDMYAPFEDVFRDKFIGKVRSQIYNAILRSCNKGEYPAGLTFGEVRHDLFDKKESEKFLSIRNFGAKSLRELREVMSK